MVLEEIPLALNRRVCYLMTCAVFSIFAEFDSVIFPFDDVRKVAVGDTVMSAISGDFYKISVAN